MKRSLILYIDDAWPTRAECPWVVLDNRNQVLEQGFSSPQHWPPASSCAVVLGGGQCVRLTVRLPRGARREEEALLRYALEEKLVDDVEHQHVTVIGRGSDDDGQLVSVLVVAKSRMRQLSAELAAVGRAPDRIVSELQAAPKLAGKWVISVGPTGETIVNVPDQQAIVVDPETLDELLALLLQQARARAEPPDALALMHASERDAQRTALTALTDDVPVEDGGLYAWWGQLDSSEDIQHGSFGVSRRHGGVLARFRLPAFTVAAAVLVLLGANIVELMLKRQQLDTIEMRMLRIFETSVPGTPAIAPAAQLRRALDQQLASHGRLRHDDFLQLLDIATDSAGTAIRGQITTIEYAEGTLQLSFRPDSKIDAGLIAARLGASGLVAHQPDGSPNVLTLTIKRTP